LSSSLKLNTRHIPKKFSLWHAICSRKNRHARKTNVKVESAPAAITSLSAACRCASRPPSNPSVFLPKLNPVRNDWVLPFYADTLFCGSTNSEPGAVATGSSFKLLELRLRQTRSLRLPVLNSLTHDERTDHCWVRADRNSQRLHLIVRSFQKTLFHGTQAALRETGTHG